MLQISAGSITLKYPITDSMPIKAINFFSVSYKDIGDGPPFLVSF